MHLCILFCMHIYAYIYIHMVELVFTYTVHMCAYTL